MLLHKYIETNNINGILEMIRNKKLKKNDIVMRYYTGYTPLLLASYHGHLEIVKLLITVGNLQKDDMLLRSGSEMRNNNGETPLFMASYYGHLEIVKLLIALCCREDIMIKNNDGDTALFMASARGHLEIVKLLIKKGNLPLRIKEDIMMKNNNGTSAYNVAKNQSIKQLFDNILFNEVINDMIIDITIIL